MKILLIIGASLGIIFIVGQFILLRTTSDIEIYSYKVLKKYDHFEIRKYEEANFSYVTMKTGSYQESSGSGFKSLAGYIFGGNEKKESIAMTSPVVVNLNEPVTMQFMVPSKYKLDDLPKPNNTDVKFKTEKQKFVATISFGGWSNDKKIKEYTAKLKELLKENQITHFNNFSYFGYNPPFQLLNRRNEIAVEIAINSIPELNIEAETN
ncbi:MAG: heme-binding protein [Gelidibacter sp.]|nr:heme-binding protein [Gelidibacter sp.]